MKEVLRTTDPLTMVYAADLMAAEGITAFQFDQHMSVLEGSIGILPRRHEMIAVRHHQAAAILRDHGIG